MGMVRGLTGRNGKETPMENITCEVERTGVEWQAVIEAQARSQSSAACFCRKQGIDYRQFLYHCNNIRKKAGGRLAITVPATAASIARQRGFVPIRVAGAGGLRLRFSRGLTLESDELPPASWIAEVALCWENGGAPC